MRSTRQPYGDYYGDSLDLAPNAARFDVSLAWFSHVGAAVSLGLLADWQRQGYLAPVVRLAERLSNALGLEPTGSTLVSVPVADAEATRRELANSGIRAAVRAGSVRLAPHVYTTQEEIDRAALAMAPFVRQPVGR